MFNISGRSAPVAALYDSFDAVKFSSALLEAFGLPRDGHVLKAFAARAVVEEWFESTKDLQEAYMDARERGCYTDLFILFGEKKGVLMGNFCRCLKFPKIVPKEHMLNLWEYVDILRSAVLLEYQDVALELDEHDMKPSLNKPVSRKRCCDLPVSPDEDFTFHATPCEDVPSNDKPCKRKALSSV
jgi:hypothetical protein